LCILLQFLQLYLTWKKFQSLREQCLLVCCSRFSFGFLPFRRALL
jgi:hypothetical protein